ncbi:MAG: protein jag [Selenomonadaceae bacterium]|nr:protein jag [Selenomonadaceae bacterium]
MARMIEKTGKTIEEAIRAAVAELGVEESELEIEVLEEPSKKFLGLFGGTPAKIRATVKVVSPPPIEVVKPVEPVKVEEPAQIEETPAPVIEPVLEPSPVEETSEAEPVDREQVINAAEKFLQDVFATMKLEVTIEVQDAEDGCLFNLSGKGLGVLIGKHGQALDALQYLLNLSVNRKHDEKIYFTLDVEDYRNRRAEAVTKLAKSVAERAIKTRKEVKLEPMSRHERKIIHTVLQENNRVETHSAGEEPYRYVIVSPKRGRR